MNPISVKKHGWLFVAALAMFVMASGSLMGYYKRLEVPQDLVPAQGHFLTGTCELFREVSVRGISGQLLAKPVVQYEYVFQGNRYVSSRYTRSKEISMDSEAQCERYLVSLRAQPQSRIWLDPDKPEISVLVASINPPAFEYIFIGVGIFFLVFGLYFVFRRERQDD